MRMVTHEVSRIARDDEVKERGGQETQPGNGVQHHTAQRITLGRGRDEGLRLKTSRARGLSQDSRAHSGIMQRMAGNPITFDKHAWASGFRGVWCSSPLREELDASST